MKKNIGLPLALLALVAAAAAAMAWRQADAGLPTARVLVDGVVYHEVNLHALTQNETMTIPLTGGRSTVIEMAPGRIRVKRADCPDQICVHQGWISDGTMPIVCLPYRLVIEITGGADSLDAATG